jgi:hypothetical protein
VSNRRLVLAAVVVTLAAAAAAGVVAVASDSENSRLLSLQQVQAAFAKSGMPLPCVIQKGRPFHPCGFNLIIGTKRQPIPAKAHLIAIASTRGSAFSTKKKFDPSKVGVVEIFDSAAGHQAMLKIGGGNDRIAVKNIYYSGAMTEAARQAMASLAGK